MDITKQEQTKTTVTLVLTEEEAEALYYCIDTSNEALDDGDGGERASIADQIEGELSDILFGF